MEIDHQDVPDGWEVVPKAPTQSAPSTPQGSSAALGLSATRAVADAATQGAMQVATHPNVPKIGSTLGQVVGGIEGAIKGGPLGAAGGAWTGGKAGWFTGKLAQKVSAPVASTLMRAQPYMQTLSTVAGAQGINDLAQIFEPNRKDIGFLGIGPSQEVPGAEMPLINMIVNKAKDAFQDLLKHGLSAEDAKAALLSTLRKR